MKVLDAADLHSGIAQMQEKLKTHYSEIVQIEDAVKGFIALEDEFKGKGGKAIRTYYEEMHIPLLTEFKAFIKDYENRLEVMKSELYALESVQKGYIVEQFLTDDLRMGLKKAENETVALTDEVNKAILSIADLVVIPELDDSEFLTQLNKANTYRKNTIEALDQFDYEQSVVIGNLHNDLTKIQQYINQVKKVFKSGKLQIDTYVSGDLKNHGVDELIKTDVEANSCTREELELAEQKRVEDLKNKLINATSTEEYLKIANEIGFENLTEAQQGIVLELETGKQNLEILKGIGVGLFDVGKDLVTGVWDFATGDPITEIRPVETFNYVKKAILDSFDHDVMNGDSYSRAHWISYAVGTLFSGGIGGTAKAGAVTTKALKGVETVNKMNKTVDIKKYLPYAPQHQLATPEGIPYNVVNSEGVKEKLISMARMETKSNANKTYKRPSRFRKGVRDEVWAKAKDTDGNVKDPITDTIMNQDEPWDMGHKPGYEFRKHQQSAMERGITRKEFLDEHNNPDHYRPELPSSNRSHKGEDLTDDYFGD